MKVKAIAEKEEENIGTANDLVHSVDDTEMANSEPEPEKIVPVRLPPSLGLFHRFLHAKHRANIKITMRMIVVLVFCLKDCISGDVQLICFLFRFVCMSLVSRPLIVAIQDDKHS